jgi:hypothetical protein
MTNRLIHRVSESRSCWTKFKVSVPEAAAESRLPEANRENRLHGARAPTSLRQHGASDYKEITVGKVQVRVERGKHER